MSKHRIEKVIITNFCMVYKNNQILVQKRTKKDWPGLTFPGGHVEKDENFMEAVKREVKEETGLNLKHPILCGIEEFKSLHGEERHIILFYKCNEFSGKIHSSKEGNVFWINRSDLNKYKLSNDFTRMLKVIESDKYSELIYYKDKEGKYHSTIE